jgi:hypothetical protein
MKVGSTLADSLLLRMFQKEADERKASYGLAQEDLIYQREEQEELEQQGTAGGGGAAEGGVPTSSSKMAWLSAGRWAV